MRVIAVTFLLAAGIAATVAFGAEPKTMSVQVRSGELRDTPSFLGNVVATLKYADRVIVQDQQGPWYKATPEGGGPTGWIHSSAITKKKIVLTAGDEAKEAASSGELALAGKGFNSDIEAEFKSRNKNISFVWVDKMLAIKIPPRRLVEFLKDGDVVPPKGGAQ